MDSLSDLGLTSYEERAYRALLTIGTGTAATVATESGVPKGRIYDALGGLRSRGLVREQTAGEPKRYAPVEPEIAVDRLVEARTRELSERIEQYRSGRDDLVDRLSRTETPDDSFWTAAVGAADSQELLFERIDAAEDRLVVAADAVSTQFELGEEGDAMLDRLLGATRRGVTVSVLLSPHVLDAAIDAIDDERAARALAQTPFELRITDEVYGTFHLIDGTEVCLEVADPLAPDRLFGMLDLRDPSFATRVGEGFDAAWERATPIEDL